MDDRKVGADDRNSAGRQNIYYAGDRQRFSPKDVARIANVSPITIRLIHRQFHIGEKIDGRISFSADDVAKIQERQKALHHHKEEECVNMSKRPAQMLHLDPLIWKLFDSNRSYTERLEGSIRQQHDISWGIRKSMAVLAEEIQKIKDRLDKLEQGDRGRGVASLAARHPHCPGTYGAEAA